MSDYVLTELTYKLQTGLYYQSPDTNKIKYSPYSYVRRAGDSFAAMFNGNATIELYWGEMPSDPATASGEPLSTSSGRIFVSSTGDGSHPYKTEVQLTPPLSFTVPEDATNAAFLLFKNGSTIICGVPIVRPSDPSINYEYSHYYDKGPGLILQSDNFYPGDLVSISELSINQPIGSLTDAPFFTLTQQVYYSDGSNILQIGVRMDGDPSGQSVNLSTSDGQAHSGSDYASVNTTLTWSAGDAAVKIVNVTILNDANTTPVDFNITLSNANPASALKQEGYIGGNGIPNGASIYQAKGWIKKSTEIILPPPPPPPPAPLPRIVGLGGTIDVTMRYSTSPLYYTTYIILQTFAPYTEVATVDYSGGGVSGTLTFPVEGIGITGYGGQPITLLEPYFGDSPDGPGNDWDYGTIVFSNPVNMELDPSNNFITLRATGY